MLSFRQRNRNYTVLLITSLGIVGLVLYYIIIYIPENEQRINARNFRVLHRIGANLSSAIDNYVEKVGQGYGKQVLEELYYKDPSIKGAQSFKSISGDSIWLTADAADHWLQSKAARQLIEGRTHGLNYSPGHEQAEHDTHIEKRAGGTFLHFASIIAYGKEDPSSIKFNFDAPFYFHTRIRVDSLLNPLMRWDNFAYFVIFRKKGTGRQQTAEVIYKGARDHPHRNPIDLLLPDSLVALANKTGGRQPAEAAIAGETFQLYLLHKRISAEENWVLCAAVPADRYEKERRAIPAHLVTFGSLLLALLIFSVPFLKLVLINNQERLNKSDVVFAGLSVFAGVAMLVLLLLDGYVYYVADNKAEARRLEKLAAEIENNLTWELDGLLQQLELLDALPDTRPAVADFKKDSLLAQYFARNAASGRDATRHVVRVFWVDTAGYMVTSWTNNKKPDRRYRVNNRSYFSNILEERGWTMDHTPTRFALESVSSMIDGRKYAVISRKSTRSHHNQMPKARVVALTTKLSSLYHAVLPPGYGFCIIDKQGTVWFHQQEKLNLNENLLEETSFPPALQAAMYSRVPAHFEVHYQGNKQRLFIDPIRQLPLFLVTYVNHDYQKVTNLHLIMVTVMMLSLYFILLGFLLALVVYARSRPVNLPAYWFAFKWLWPKSSYAHLYLKTNLLLLATILLVLGLADPSRPVSTFFMLLFAAVYNFIFCYTSFHAIPIRWVFRSRLYFFSVSSVVILLVLNACALITGTDTFQLGVLFQLMLLGLLWAINRIFYKYSSYASTWKCRYRRFYNQMLLCWLLLTSALPAFVFFRIAYNYEMELTLRYHQLYLAQMLSRRPAELAWPDTTRQQQKRTQQGPASFVYAKFLYNTHPAAQAPGRGQNAASRSAKPVLLLNQGAGRQADDTSGIRLRSPWLQARQALQAVQERAAQKEGRQANGFVMLVRPTFRNVLANAFFLKADCHPAADCHPNHWQLQDSLLHFRYSNELNQEHTIKLSSSLPRFQLPAVLHAHTTWPANINHPGWFFWADAAILAIFVYFLISFLVQRIFSLDLHWIKPLGTIDQQFLDPAVKNKLLVIALPVAPGIRQLLHNQQPADGKAFQLIQIDLAKTDFTAGIRMLELGGFHLPVVLLIKNFDFDPYSEEALKYKVTLLQTLHAMPQLKVIIQTSLHPACWQQKLAEGEEEKQKGEKGPSKAAYLAILEQLLILLGAYIKLYQPLQRQAPASTSAPKYLMPQKEYLLRLIRQECSSCFHLHQFEDTLVKYVEDAAASKKKVTKEDIIFLLQERAQLYYRYIWTSCSEEEQYFLYDLAQDGLVNARNKHVLSALLGKGLLVQEEDATMKIMNVSFQKFVLHVVDPAEALRFEKMNAQSSKWDLFKTPLMLIFVAGALFIFFTQKQTWLNIVTVLAAFSTIIGILPRLSALLPAMFAGKEAHK